MSNQQKHITPWSASDVQKYLRGELSRQEMHQFEKAALDDPFLADAIEGLSQRAGMPLEHDLHELQSRLSHRVRTRKQRIVLLPWMKMAAAVVLLLGLGFSAWYTLLDHHAKTLAKTESQARLSPPAPQTLPPASAHATPSANADSTVIAVPNSAPAKSETAKYPTAPPVARVERVPPATQVTRTDDAPLAHSDVAPQVSAKITSDSLQYMLKNKVDISPAYRVVPDSILANKQLARATPIRNEIDFRTTDRKSFYSDSQSFYKLGQAPGFRASPLVFSGQVLDRNNRPLSGASLLVSGPSNTATTTNALGRFQLSLRPQDTTQRLTVALVGYENAYLAVNRLNTDEATGNTIFLRENPSALKEVLVTGMGKNRKESIAQAPSDDKSEKLDSFWIKVTPVTGRIAYLQYLETAKKNLPVDSSIRGTEIISFGIDPNGLPTDFKIEQSLSPSHDAGVVRLITEGAAWKVLHGKNIRALVTISFP